MTQRKTSKQNSGKTYAVVVARFNEFITQRLLDGCLEELGRLGVAKKNIQVVWVPGAFEIPLVAKRLAARRSVAAVIALGAVIRGETYHFELVADNVAQGVMRVGLESGKPVIFGVITTETVDQAYKRSGDGDEHKGRDAARAAFDMVKIMSGE
ncbi:MAG TPA: 6,7-dimethyl-8-ribityllumazine synthase [Candidatus Bathyarchaeia archaeon]|nr:6,7-dimethyl-8-ribityllumazine synthase [Candidatus Bathyarchaeia archaeon]